MSLLRRCLNALPGRSVELQASQRWMHALWCAADPSDPAQREIASIPKGREVQVSTLDVDAVRPWGKRDQGAGETVSLGDSTEGKEMSEAEWGDWIEWKGGECPVKDGILTEARWADGEVLLSGQARVWIGWKHQHGLMNIVAYRVKRTQAQSASANATQVGGTHYKDMPMQPWDVMEAVLTPEEFRGFLKGNILKYSMRAGKKEGTDDAGKARHYRQKLREVEGGNV